MKRVFALLASVVAWAHAGLAVAEYPLAYVGYPDARDMALSPDGSTVAILMTDFEFGIRQRRDWDVIEFKSAETGDVVYSHDLDDRLYFWVDWPLQDVLLAQTLKYDIRRRSAKTQAVILAINPQTGEERTLYEGSKGSWRKQRDVPKISGVSIDRREIAIEVEKSGRMELIAINVDSGAKRVLDKGNRATLRWTLGDDFEPIMRFDQGPKQSEEIVLTKDGSGRWVRRQKYNTVENDFRPASNISASNQMMVIHRPEHADKAALYTMDMATNTYGDIVFEHPEFDLVSARRATFGGRLMYVAWLDDKIERAWFDKTDEAAGAMLDKALKPTDNWSILQTSQSGEQWLIYVSSPTRPGAYMHFDLARKKLRTMANERPDLKPSILAPMQRIDYQASDGTNLFGYFLPSRLDGPAPLIVMPHGGPVVRDIANFDGIAQFLAFKGYNVFQPQFRGGGGLGRAFEEAGHGQWGRAMQTDIEDGVQELIAQGLVAPNAYRSILGLSYGGYAALAGATLTPDNYLCAVSINGVGDLPMMLASYDRNDDLEREYYNIWVRRIGDPETEMERIISVSPRHQLSRLKAQVLLIHGTEDDVVSVRQSRAMYESILALDKFAVFHELEGAGHHIYNQDQRTEMLVMVDRFLSQCMPVR